MATNFSTGPLNYSPVPSGPYGDLPTGGYSTGPGTYAVNNTSYALPSNGQVLAAATGPTAPAANQAPNFGSNPNPVTNLQHQQDLQRQQDAINALIAQQRNAISNGWDSYTNQLNDVLNNGLPQQQTAQNNIINDQYNQGVNTANTQKAQSLKDIADNIKNAFQAGNIYLGSRGAGDSSASDQYSFALNQEAAKQNSNLNQFVNTQLSNLASQRDSQINQVANWYAGAQNQLKQAIAQGAVSKASDLASLSQNLLNTALGQLNNIQQSSQSQYNAMLSWAANNSGSLGQLKSNIASIPQPIQSMQLDSNGNAQAPVGYGYSNNSNDQKAPTGYGATDTSNGLFSNPAWFQ